MKREAAFNFIRRRESYTKTIKLCPQSHFLGTLYLAQALGLLLRLPQKIMFIKLTLSLEVFTCEPKVKFVSYTIVTKAVT